MALRLYISDAAPFHSSGMTPQGLSSLTFESSKSRVLRVTTIKP
jgi:hypothetical protein